MIGGDGKSENKSKKDSKLYYSKSQNDSKIYYSSKVAGEGVEATLIVKSDDGRNGNKSQNDSKLYTTNQSQNVDESSIYLSDSNGTELKLTDRPQIRNMALISDSSVTKGDSNGSTVQIVNYSIESRVAVMNSSKLECYDSNDGIQERNSNGDVHNSDSNSIKTLKNDSLVIVRKNELLIM